MTKHIIHRLAILAFLISSFAFVADTSASEELDKYGGVLTLKGEATAAFHVEMINGRDCLVTPDGHAFFSLGVNHITAIGQHSRVDLFSERYQRDWVKLSESAHKNLLAWKYNTAGYSSPRALWEKMPFMADSFLAKNSNFLPDKDFFYPDVFDPMVQQGMKDKLRRMCNLAKGRPNLIGYYWTDTPQWDLARARQKRGVDWVTAIRALPDNAPGKQRYREFLSSRKDSDSKEAGDISFLSLIAREYYSIVGAETRKLHPGALVFGERYLIGDHPDVVVQEALPWIDVLAIQPGGAKFNGQLLEQLHKKFGKPILLCDHQCSFATPQYPKTMWQQLESQHAVIEAYRRYLIDVMKKPYIVGYHRCQYIDRFVYNKGVLKQGLLREDGSPYEELINGVRKANGEAMELSVKTVAR